MAALLLRPAATAIDWEIIKGDTFDIHVPVLDANKNAVTVTGWTGKAQVRRSEDDPVLHEWSVDASNITVTGTEVVLAVIGSATALWRFDVANVSVEVTDLDGKPHTIADGTLRALPQTTQ